MTLPDIRRGRCADQTLTRQLSLIASSTALLACFAMPAAAQEACPDLTPYYQTGEAAWPTPAILAQLTGMMGACLESAQYYALLGAAQLHAARVSDALEALERALLLDPEHGAARIDYAQALYIAGQLFPALEINQSLLDRTDLPPNMRTQLETRARQWQRQTHNKGLIAEVAAGFDDNLNGAPAKSDFMLTLAGEPLLLELSSEYQPESGGYLNLQLGGYYQKQTPDHSHDLQYGLRSRQSDNSANELLQLDWRYTFVKPVLRRQWEFSAGSSHLMFGGNPLYSVTEGRARYRFRQTGCNPHYELAAQHQLYHGQNFMSGLETSASGGIECIRGNHLLSAEAGLINNSALKGRPGDDRQGWKLRLGWQIQLGEDALSAQFGFADLSDAEGYSPLLANGARRKMASRSMQVQYLRPLQPDLALIINLNHQGQGSNIDPFENHSTSFEVGLRLSL